MLDYAYWFPPRSMADHAGFPVPFSRETLEGVLSMNLRDIVGLGLFIVAALIAASFCLENNPNSRPGAIELGRVQNSGATPTPIARPHGQELKDPGPWAVTYSPADSQPGQPFTEPAPKLDLPFDRGPHDALPDDHWQLMATAALATLAPGSYHFSIQHDGDVRIYINGQQMANESDRNGTVDLDIDFDHKGGSFEVRIEARDRAGPFVLRWKQ